MNITIETSLGTITAELYQEKAPLTVSNILAYVDEKFYDNTIFHRVINGFMIQGGVVDEKFYDNTIFHRVINGFMIQGGGFTKDMQQKTTKPPVKSEADNGLSNTRGTLAMARTMIVDSATCQFFINLEDRNAMNLDFKSKTDMGWGYCVFGKVTEGLDIVDKIAKVETGFSGRHQNVPVDPVMIKSIRRKE